MNKNSISKEEIKSANKKFYDIVADSYENIDGRRSVDLEIWMKDTLKKIRKIAPGGKLVDLGTGSGFLTRCAKGIFEERIGTDISQKILDANKENFDLGVCCDVDKLPFDNGSIDAVTCFAVLHHLYSYEDMIKEVSRVLKPGGVFYSDHDMDLLFAKYFKIPLYFYRKMNGSEKKYQQSATEITTELYHLSEWNENGIDSNSLKKMFSKLNFEVKLKYHWYGLNNLTNKIFRTASYPHGFAPLVSITAIKK